MPNQQGGELRPIHQVAGTRQAVIFLHGFLGNRDDTWDRFPYLLGVHVAEWDIYTLGYATTLQPDIIGAWSADPELPILGTMFRTQMDIAPLSDYTRLAFVAHSMGGLVVQRALVDNPTLSGRVSHVILFGTPSAGLRKASWLQFWKRQLRNMATDSEFIRDLRQRWSDQFGAHPPFELKIVAGASDQFVPPASSLAPFAPRFHHVVDGDHLSMVKPSSAGAGSFRVVLAALSNQEMPLQETSAVLRHATVQAAPDIVRQVQTRGDRMSEAEVVDAALALERSGKRQESINLLERYQSLGTDVQGALAGRIKRLWIENESEDYARRALTLYEHALVQAQREKAHGQIYYHAINVAFLNSVVFENPNRAREMARLALRHCELAEADGWNIATQAEANLYLGNRDRALTLYRNLLTQETEPWKLTSTGQQASLIASKLQDQMLLEEFDSMFSIYSRRSNKIFLSYSHKDSIWMERLVTLFKPFQREAESELDLWVDRDIQPGDLWFQKIQDALRIASVAVLLVSADFLASDFIAEQELPELVTAATNGDIRLLWVYLSPAAYETTPLRNFQAASDLSHPLIALPPHEQDQRLLEVARAMKEASLSATERFKA